MRKRAALYLQGDCEDGTPIDSQSELELGKYYEHIHDYQKYNNSNSPDIYTDLLSALGMVERSASHGNVEAQLQLGKLHHLGSQTYTHAIQY